MLSKTWRENHDTNTTSETFTKYKTDDDNLEIAQFRRFQSATAAHQNVQTYTKKQ